MTQITLNKVRTIDEDNIRYNGVVNNNGNEATFSVQYIISSNSAHLSNDAGIDALGLDSDDVRDAIEARKCIFNN